MKKILVKTGLVFLSFSLILMLNAGAAVAAGLAVPAPGMPGGVTREPSGSPYSSGPTSAGYGDAEDWVPYSPPDAEGEVNAGTRLDENSESEAPVGGPLVPDSFPVNKYLKLDDQKSYVPPKDTPPPKAGEAAPPTGIVAILLRAIDLFVKLIGSIALIVFILGALLTIVSEGKEDRLEKGKTAMVYSLIGLVLTFFAFIIVAFVQSILF